MKIINNNLNFKGYKNFIGCNFDIPERSLLFTSMNVQLDNTDTHDLDNYRQVLKLMYSDSSSLDKDVVHCLRVDDPSEKILLFNDVPLYDSVELNKLSKRLPPKDFAKIEKANLKAYSFLAGITKRIMQNDLVNHDAGITSAISQCLEMFQKQLRHPPKEAFELLNQCFLNPPEPGHVARKINEGVNKAILNYFK